MFGGHLICTTGDFQQVIAKLCLYRTMDLI